jgi:hypothetical protein
MSNGKDIKVRIYSGLLLCLPMLIPACHPKERNSDATVQTQTAEQRARAHLAPMLKIGENKTNLLMEFGPPVDQYETGNGELRVDFNFFDRDQSALAAGVGGFTAFFRSNCLNRWGPIYETESP